MLAVVSYDDDGPVKKPRIFVSVPYRELRDLYGRSRRQPRARIKETVTMGELVMAWSSMIGEPKGYRVRRWSYDSDTDRFVMDLEKK